MPMTYDEPQTFALLSFWIGHNRQDIRMAETLPDEADEAEDEEDDDEEES
jgi:hypothetical protein